MMKTNNPPIYLNELGLVSALGSGQDATLKALLAGSTEGMRATEAYSPGKPLVCGRVEAPLPSLAGRPDRMNCRNNALLLMALAQIRPAVDAAIARYGPTRVGVVM